MEYEWDENKNKINQEKHGIDFLDAVQVFLDPNRMEMVDDRKEYGETRYLTIGEVETVFLFVVYTKRGHKCRLISARRASKNEREIYYDYRS